MALVRLLRPILGLVAAMAVLSPFRPALACDDCSGRPADDKSELGLGFSFLRLADPSARLAQDPDCVYGAYMVEHGRFGPHFALEAGGSVAYGGDAKGYRRFDLDFYMPRALVYLTPRSPAQLYVLAGFTMTMSHLQSGPGATVPTKQPFMYAGGVAGLGLEVRQNSSLSARFEVFGLLRRRFTVEKDDREAVATHPGFDADSRVVQGIGFSFGVIAF